MQVTWNTFESSEKQAFNAIGITSAAVAHDLFCAGFQPGSDYEAKQNAWNFLACNYQMALDVNDGKISVADILEKRAAIKREESLFRSRRFSGLVK